MLLSGYGVLAVALNLCIAAAAPVAQPHDSPPPAYAGPSSCKKTKVAVLGAGVAGVTAAQALHSASIDDFVIIEYNDHIGGRVLNEPFGKKPDGTPYSVELGANWVQGIGTPGGPENPIWTLAKKYKLVNTYSDLTSLETFNETGAYDFRSLVDDYEDAYETFEQDAGYILTENLQDRSARTGLSIAGWTPGHDPAAQAAEWFSYDYEYAYPPDQSSHEFSVVNFNTTFYQYSDENNFVHDERGFNAFIKGEAATYLQPNDPRLHLNTIVTNISYSDTGVIVTNADGTCVAAEHAICTFSIGVLQSDAVAFEPEFPAWKTTGIQSFEMGTYTKIFMQFPPDQVFWNTSTQFFLYADPVTRGYYPVFQSLDAQDFLPGSGIFFVTVVHAQSYVVEAQDDATTKAQVLEVLHDMFGADNVPEPIDFMYPRWTSTP